MKSIVVFCGSSLGNDPKIIDNAYAVGKYCAKNNITVIYGGGKVGLMGQVARGVLEENGKIIGVIPHFLKEKEVHHTGLTQLIEVETMHERKLKMHELSDGILMLPGGFGTLEEFFEMLTWAQLGLHQKPIGMLNINCFFDDLLQLFLKMVEDTFVKAENLSMILVGETIGELIPKMEGYVPSFTAKWIDKEQT